MGGQDEADEEAKELRIVIASVVLLIVGLAGMTFGVAGAIIFPFFPSMLSGSLLAGTSFITCLAALIVLRVPSGNIQTAAHRAAVLCIIAQIAASFVVLLITTGSRYNFCDTRKECWVFPRAVLTDRKCIKALDGKGCQKDYSYLCHKVPIEGEGMIDISNKNCESTLSDRCPNGDRFWGFDGRDDCLDFYTNARKGLLPNISYILIAFGGVLQFVIPLLYGGVLRTLFD